MDSIVLELQREALDPKCSVSDLLRRAFVVAKKLKLEEFERWTSNELNGYRGPASEVPAYRKVLGQVMVYNPYQGRWMPLVFASNEESELLSRRLCGQSVAELQDLLLGKAPGSPLMMSFSAETEKDMMKRMGEVALQPVLHVSPSAVAGILDAVRTTVLNWALRMEEEGILGEGLSFSPQEQTRASASESHVTNFFAPVSQSQFAQGAQSQMQVVVAPAVNIAEIVAILSKVKEAASDGALGDEQASELRAEIATVESQVQSPKPKGAIIKQALASARTIIEGAGNKIVAALIDRWLGGS